MDLGKLVKEAQAGNNDAFGCLYRIFFTKMKGVCIKILKRNDKDVDDIVHDAFILALTSINQLKNPDKFGEWLTTITTNTALKYLEKSKKMPSEPLTLFSDEALEIPDNDDNYCDYPPITDISYQKILETINKLPDGYKQVFKLSVIDGLTHAEIAKILGIAPHSSSSQLHRARRLLRKMLLGIRLAVILLFLSLLIPLYKYLHHKRPNDNYGKQLSINSIYNKNIPKAPITSAPNVELGCKNDIETAATPIKQLSASRNMVALADTSCSQPGIITGPGHQSLIAQVCDSLNPAIGNNKINIPLRHTHGNETLLHINKSKTNGNGKHKKWKLLIASSLSPALVQSAYKLITADSHPNVGSSQPVTETIRTWEEYYNYLSANNDGQMPPDSAALINIAKNNSGQIIENEKHEKPITFGLSFTKAINDRWSIETGLQYSQLKSTFTMGNELNNISKYQKIHYIGIPVRISYRFADYKKLSAYGSAGVTLNIPVKSSIKQYLITDSTSIYLDTHNANPSIQWSASAGLGLQYRLTPTISLYVEPSINYYIPNGSSTHTTWTERPFTFSMPVGIRFTW